MPDLSQMSDADLMKLHSDVSKPDLSSMSDEELKKLASSNEDKPKGTSLGSKAFSAVSGLGKGATLGFGPAMAGGVGATIDAIMDDKSRPFIERYREARDYAQKVNEDARAANPKSFFGGELLGGAAATAPLGAAGVSAKGAGAVGALAGLGNSKADLSNIVAGQMPPVADLKQAAKDTAISGGLSAATAGLLNSAPALKDKAGKMFLRGSGFTPKELTESELQGGLLDKAKTGLDEGIAGWHGLRSVKGQIEAAKDLSKTGGSEMGNILEQAVKKGARVDPAELKQAALNKIGSQFNPLMELAQPEASALGKVTQAMDVSGKNGPISPQDAQGLKGVFDKYARWNRPGELPETQVLADTLRQGSNITKQGIDKSVQESVLGPGGQGPTKELANLYDARNLHGTGEELGQALDRYSGKINAGGGGPGFANRAIAGGVGAAVGGPAGFAGAEALAGPVARHVNTFGATMLNHVANLALQAPEKLGLAPATVQAIKSAASRGDDALVATSHVLQQSDEKYREMMRHLNGQPDPQQ